MPCLTCGELSTGSRCPDHSAQKVREREATRLGSSARGYDSSWRRLVARALRLQRFCSDCGATERLTGDHLRWPAVTLADVEVVCLGCNIRRGTQRRLDPLTGLYVSNAQGEDPGLGGRRPIGDAGSQLLSGGITRSVR